MRRAIVFLSLLVTRIPTTFAQFDAFNGGLAKVDAAIHGNLSSNLPRSLNLFERFELESLEKRQGSVCEAGPGGPVCSATTCCAAGNRCCSNGCCPSDSNCHGTDGCCPTSAQTCGGTTCCLPGTSCCSSSPTKCCVGGAVCCSSTRAPCCPSGSTCCGDTCCLSGETCERKQCVSTALILSKRIVRFESDLKKNAALLRNLCKGMQGANTVELTYSGQLSASDKKKKRGASGCTSGFCRALGQSGLNSCDEFPPAISDEGGDILSLLTRAASCIPATQNCRQGQHFSAMVKNSNIVKGQQFVLSIDCDQVLLQTVPTPPPVNETSNGVTTEDNVFPPDSSLGETKSSVIVGLGDLGPGKYTIDYTVNSGAVDAGACVLDNFGDSYASSSSALSQGQSGTLTFTIEANGELMGVGLILPAPDGNSTAVSWTFRGENLGPDATNSQAASNAGPTSGAHNLGMEYGWGVIIGILGFVAVL